MKARFLFIALAILPAVAEAQSLALANGSARDGETVKTIVANVQPLSAANGSARDGESVPVAVAYHYESKNIICASVYELGNTGSNPAQQVVETDRFCFDAADASSPASGVASASAAASMIPGGSVLSAAVRRDAAPNI